MPSRRTFLKAAAASALFPTFTIGGTKSSAKVLGANERVRVAVAGINGRGKSHIGGFGELPNVEIAYLIDPDTRLFDSRAKMVEEKSKHRPKTVADVREALDDNELNAVSVATPNHWHTLLSVWACQAGKDVYVEKPLSHNVHEGRVLVETAKKYGRVVQHGTQSRNSGKHAERAKQIAAGEHGKLLVSRGTCFKRRDSIGFKEPSPAPAGVDFNLWLGPAPEQPHHANLVHYNWHWFWDFGNGDIGNQGVHQMDIARWMIPSATLPKSVVSVGGRFGYKDQGQTPNTMVSVFDYGDAMLVFEVRGLPTEGGITNDQTFDENASASPKEVARHEGVKDPTAERGSGGHFGNFIECVRNRTPEKLDANVLEGHYSSALCHLANVSYRLGENVAFDSQREVFAGNAAASEAFAKMREHLKDNGVKLEGTEYRVGRFLRVDAESEKVIDDEEANGLLTRKYREGFGMGEVV